MGTKATSDFERDRLDDARPPHAYRRLVPSTTALIVIDMQNYYMQDGMPACCPDARAIVPKVNSFAATVRRLGGHVIWVVSVALPEPSGDWGNFYEMRSPEITAVRRRLLARDGEGQALWHEMDRQPDDLTVTKLRYSAFTEGSSDLEAHLRGRGIDTVLIAGVATNVCCESTGRDAMMRNFRTVMISDGLAAGSKAEHESSLAAFRIYFGDVQKTNEAIAYLEECSRDEPSNK